MYSLVPCWYSKCASLLFDERMHNSKTINAIANVQIAIIKYFSNLVLVRHKVTPCGLTEMQRKAKKKNMEKRELKLVYTLLFHKLYRKHIVWQMNDITQR